MKLFDVLLITVVIYLPTLLGKYKKNEETLFWSSLISSVLTVISFFLIENGEVHLSRVFFMPVLIGAVFGFVNYLIYRLNYAFNRRRFSPLAWLIILPFVDTVILRKYGISTLSVMNSTHQLLVWFVPSNVIVMAIIGAIVYFFIFWRNGFKRVWWEGVSAFVVGIVSGYIYVKYGFLTAFLAEIAFNFWRIAFATSQSEAG